jgi:hypothetical protein
MGFEFVIGRFWIGSYRLKWHVIAPLGWLPPKILSLRIMWEAKMGCE